MVKVKILLYSEAMKWIEKSGLGRAISHQKKALAINQVAYTTDPKDSFDCVHINTYFFKSLLLAKRMNKKGIAVVYHAHSTEEDFRNSFLFSNVLSPLFRKWIIRCYNLGDIVITPTPYAKQLLEKEGVKRPIYSISNGIDLSFYQSTNEMKQQFRDRYGFSSTDKIIMSVGLYIKRKGILDFVALAKRMPDYQFIWFGFLDLKKVPREIRQAVKTELPNLTFAGYVPADHLKEAYAGTDLFFFPTYEETEGIVLLEAMAMGKTCLIRDIPIYADYQDASHLYKASDQESFYTAINHILEGDWPSLQQTSLRAVQQRDIKEIGKQLKEAYQDAIKIKQDKSCKDGSES